MRQDGQRRVPPVALTARGVVQLLCAGALLAAGMAGGWHALAAAGAALALAAALGLAEVLLARGLRSGAGGPAGPLGVPERSEDDWVRVNQHGSVISRPGHLPAERGLYRQRSVTLTWHDLLGFWRARRVEATDREVSVPPAADPALVRLVCTRPVARALDLSAERDPSGVRPYEPGDGLRQISWRQTAHHGELMSIERAGGQAPPVLVVADTLGASDPDALAGTAAALLSGLRRAPDVLLTDGLSSWRAPARQERFLAALVADEEAQDEARVRAGRVARLATEGTSRRRVLLVTCDAHGPLARELAREPLGRALVVVEARPGAAPAAAREGIADQKQDEKDVPPAPVRAAARAARVADELMALLCSCALALLAMVPFLDMIRDGVWSVPVAALLGCGTALSCGVGSALARRGARPSARAAAAIACAVALLVAGALAVVGVFRARHGFGLLEATSTLERAGMGAGADFLGAARTLVEAGVAQLGGQPFASGDAAWDLTILLGGAALAGVCALLSSVRPARPAVALVPLGLAAADQSVMGTVAPVWTAAVCALGLALAWLAAPRDHRAARSALAVLLACALGAAGSLVVPRDGTPFAGLARGTRVETLVDLSRDLRRNSNAVALTYTTNAGRPLYLRTAVLEDFDGSVWRANEDEGALLDEPVGTDRGVMVATPTVTTTIRTNGGSSPVPPGTVSVRSTGTRTYVATGTYREPLTSVADVNELGAYAAALSSWGLATGDPDELLSVGGEPGERLSAVVSQARSEGVLDSNGHISAIRWLVDYFTSGGFTYAIDAPGGDGRDNLAVIDDFLAERRGYCTHYATAFTVLARQLGVPARVVLGYQPEGSASADGGYEVTMRQLHAWSEVWVDGVGWTGVDVTPAAGSSQPHASATTPNAPVVPESLDVATDVDAPEETTGPDEPDEEPEAEAAPSEGAGAPEAPARLAPALLGLAAAGTVTATAALALLARRRRLERGDWDYAWRRICRAARRAGVRWDRSATEQDVAEAICARLDDGALAAAARAAARNACLARYGAGYVTADGTRLPRLLHELARTLRQH